MLQNIHAMNESLSALTSIEGLEEPLMNTVTATHQEPLTQLLSSIGITCARDAEEDFDEDMDDEDDDADFDDYDDELDEDFEEFEIPKSKKASGKAANGDDDFAEDDELEDFDLYDDEDQDADEDDDF